MADISESDAVGSVLDSAIRIFGHVLHDVEPYDEPTDCVRMSFFRRLTELQDEYCRGIRALYDSRCSQSALPVLRSLVEVTVAQVSLHRDHDSGRMLQLLQGGRVKTDAALKAIDWPASQSDIYARLSQMAHPSRVSAFLGRMVDWESEPLKSLIARQDMAGIAHLLFWDAAPEDEEARQERWTFIALNLMIWRFRPSLLSTASVHPSASGGMEQIFHYFSTLPRTIPK
jgi:hypothetical protein